MAQTVVDEVMLREPRLLVPGRQPLGLVRVDRSHPLARRLIYANFPYDLAGLNMANNQFKPWTPKNATYAYPLIKRGEKCVTTGTSATTANRGLSLDSGTSAAIRYALNTSGTMTVLAITETSYDSGSDFLFGDHDAAGTSTYNWGLYRGYSTDKYLLYLRNTSNTVVSVSSNNTYGLDTQNVVAATYNGANMTICVNGSDIASAAQTGGIDNEVGTNLIRQAGWAASTPYSAYQNYFLALWDRSISPAELQSLSSDPYQFLIPA